MTRPVILAIITAAALWTLMFSPWTASFVPFWPAMTVSACILTTIALCCGGRASVGLPLDDRPLPTALCSMNPGAIARTLLWGLAIATLLWGVFWVGDKLSQLLFSFARPQVELIYGMKDGSSGRVLALLLLCCIGPAEEIFWRGFIQRTLAASWSPNKAFVATTAIYTLIHLPSANFMLIMAAMTCGIAWGGLYRIMPHRLPAIIVSHALWDAAAFVWFPL